MASLLLPLLLLFFLGASASALPRPARPAIFVRTEPHRIAMSQEASSSKPYLNVRVGDRVVLECIGGRTVRWDAPPSARVVSSCGTDSSYDRYGGVERKEMLQSSRLMGHGALLIAAARARDSGRYVCYHEEECADWRFAEQGTTLANVSLEHVPNRSVLDVFVNDGENLFAPLQREVHFVSEGNHMKLPCQPTFSNADISLFFIPTDSSAEVYTSLNGSHFRKGDDGRLEILFAQLPHSGTYICRASVRLANDSIIESRPLQFELQVFAKPWTLRKPIIAELERTESHRHFQCYVHNRPTSKQDYTLGWMSRFGEALRTTTRRECVDRTFPTIRFDQWIANMTVDRRKAEGLVTCSAKSSDGEEAITYLQLDDPPYAVNPIVPLCDDGDHAPPTITLLACLGSHANSLDNPLWLHNGTSIGRSTRFTVDTVGYFTALNVSRPKVATDSGQYSVRIGNETIAQFTVDEQCHKDIVEAVVERVVVNRTRLPPSLPFMVGLYARVNEAAVSVHWKNAVAQGADDFRRPGVAENPLGYSWEVVDDTWNVTATNDAGDRKQIQMHVVVNRQPTVTINVANGRPLGSVRVEGLNEFREVVVAAGRTVEVECGARASPSVTVSLECESGGKERISEEGLHRVDVSRSANTAIVKCSSKRHLLAPDGVNSTIRLIATDLPHNALAALSNDGRQIGGKVTLVEGDRLAIDCRVNRFVYAAFDISWTTSLGGSFNELEPTNYSRVVQYTNDNVTADDARIYRCTIESADPSGVAKYDNEERIFELIVIPAIAPTFADLEEPTLHIGYGASATLVCKPSGRPAPTYKWFAGTQEITQGVTTNSDQSTSLTSSKLTTSTIYTCVAQNRAGHTQKRYHCHVPTALQRLVAIFYENKAVSIVIGLFLVVTIGGLLIFALQWHHERGRRVEIEQLARVLRGSGDIESINPDVSLAEQADLLAFDDSYELDRSRLSATDCILGSGFFGVVALGHLDASTPIAMKLPRSSTDVEQTSTLFAELKVHMHIGSHRNVVRLIGACTEGIGVDGRELIVALEFCSNGSLIDYIRANKDSYSSKSQNDRLLSESRLVDIAKHIASGMLYLASKGVVHRDLAARNVLLDECFVAKIADFGLAKQVSSGEQPQKRRQHREATYQKTAEALAESLPLKWLAPECLIERRFSTKSDVWAYGIVLYEMFSLGQQPYQDVPSSSSALLCAIVGSSYRMARPKDAPLAIYALMRQCWASDSDDRPAFEQLLEKLGSEEVVEDTDDDRSVHSVRLYPRAQQHLYVAEPIRQTEKLAEEHPMMAYNDNGTISVMGCHYA